MSGSLPTNTGPGYDLTGFAQTPGLGTAAQQLEYTIALLRAEQARRRAGIPVTRAVWKNLVFAGEASKGPGTPGG